MGSYEDYVMAPSWDVTELHCERCRPYRVLLASVGGHTLADLMETADAHEKEGHRL